MRSTPSTSIRVTTATRDELRSLADADAVTLEQALRRLIRAERQRRMGQVLASAPRDAEEREWLDLSSDGVRSDEGG